MRTVMLAVSAAAIFAGYATDDSSARPVSATAATVVSLAFDDGLRDQLVAADILHAEGFHAVFYINTGLLGADSRMTMTDVQRLASDGDEIGGHTLDHPHLDRLSEGDVWREICVDRQALLDAGLNPVGFAYPYGEPGDNGAAAVAACGYQYARLAGGLAPEASCAGCLPAEPLGPDKPDAVRAWVPTSEVNLAGLEAAVTGAEASGGLLTIVFHNVCAPVCSGWSISPRMLGDFASWLSSEQNGGRISVATPADGLGLGQTVSGGPNVLANPSFDARAGSLRCWTGASKAHATPPARVTVHGRTGRGVLLVVPPGSSTPQVEFASSVSSACAFSVRQTSLEGGIWYRSTAIVRVAVNIRENGSWRRWLLSPAFGPSSSWARATFRTPLLPTAADAVTMGVTVSGPGAAIVDDASLRTCEPLR